VCWRVVCLEQGADLHMAQLMPLPLTVSCFSKIQIGFAFLVPAHLGSPGKGPLNVCVCCCTTCSCSCAAVDKNSAVLRFLPGAVLFCGNVNELQYNYIIFNIVNSQALDLLCSVCVVLCQATTQPVSFVTPFVFTNSFFY